MTIIADTADYTITRTTTPAGRADRMAWKSPEAASRNWSRRYRSVVSIAEFGADPASPDNQAAVAAATQAAIDRRQPLYIPPATFMIGKHTAGSFCVRMLSGLEVFGEGPESVLRQVDLVNQEFVRMFASVTSSPVREVYFHDFAVDGNLANQSTNVYRSGPSLGLEVNARTGWFLMNVDGVMIERCEAYGFTGHALSAYNNATDITMQDCIIRDMNSNGITINGSAGRIIIARNRITNTRFTGVDFEPFSDPYDVQIIDNYIGAPSNPGSKSMSVGGNSDGVRLRSCMISGNRLQAPVNLVWARNIKITGNHLTVAPDDINIFGIQVLRDCHDVQISGNTIEGGGPAMTAMIGGQFSAGEAPAELRIEGNSITSAPDAIHLSGVQSARVVDNDITLTAPDRVGVRVSATANIGRVRVADNDIVGAKTPVLITRTASNTIGDVVATGNIIDGSASPTFGIEFSTTTPFVARASLGGNHFMPGVATPIGRIAAVTTQVT